MDLAQFIERVINDGIEAVRADYKEPRQKQKLEGSILGFERCRRKNHQELMALLREAQEATRKAYIEQVESYWFIRCQELEIEWVCNCVSAVLVHQGLSPIITPTARGALKAAEIVGVRGS